MDGENGLLSIHEARLSDLQKQGMCELLPVPRIRGSPSENHQVEGVKRGDLWKLQA
jgi:hypothetical protein